MSDQEFVELALELGIAPLEAGMGEPTASTSKFQHPTVQDDAIIAEMEHQEHKAG